MSHEWPEDFFIEGRKYQKRHGIAAERELANGQTVTIFNKNGKIWIESFFGSRESSWSRGKTFETVDEAKQLVWECCKPMSEDEMINF